MRLQIIFALAAPLVSAQILDSASFGHKDGKISLNRVSIPAWRTIGSDGWSPQIMTDKIIVTPPYPGNKKGGIWVEAPIQSAQWSADVEFRANGAEHGSGIFQIWYTKEGMPQINSNSIYTINKFEGLVVTVDSHGGRGGMIRGFLNDGTVDFASHPHLDEVAFGHCFYQYRNRGVPSKITIMQDSSGFEVRVDNARCFRSDSILLPSNNHFGISATSSETPDSFEVFKFITSLTSGSSSPPPPVGNQQQKVIPPPMQARDGGSGQIPDVLASTLRDQQAQFEDIHNRVQGIAHELDTVIQEIQRTSSALQARMEELHQQLAKQQNIQGLETRLQRVEDQLNNLKSSQKDWTGHFNDIHASLKARHDTLLDVLPGSVGGVIHSKGPNIKLLLFLILGFQVAGAGAYIAYKRRLSQGPKKYL